MQLFYSIREKKNDIKIYFQGKNDNGNMVYYRIRKTCSLNTSCDLLSNRIQIMRMMRDREEKPEFNELFCVMMVVLQNVAIL